MDILDQWLAPDHRYFKILGDDNSLYIIRHDVESYEWELKASCKLEAASCELQAVSCKL